MNETPTNSLPTHRLRRSIKPIKMLWSEICSKIGIAENMSLGERIPLGMLVECEDLEDFENTYETLEDYDPKPSLLNTAFYTSDSEDEMDEECERMLEEDYDW